jgi:diguanylate cyclase (GGDEF)-like protein
MERNFIGILYSDSVAFCFVLLVIILYKSLKRKNQDTIRKLYMGIIVTVMCFLITELLWGLGENGYIVLPRTANHIVNLFYFLLSGVTAYLCFLYAQIIIDTRVVHSRLNLILSQIPIYVVFVLAVSSYWTKWVFYIDESNHYQRGAYTMVHVVLVYGYILVSMIQVVIAAAKKENFLKRKEYRNILYFICIPMIFCAAQVVIQGVPLVSMGLTGGILLVYLNSEEMLISVDPLTQLSNRNKLYQYLGGKMRSEQDRLSLHLILIDVDYFKEINDRHGHVEGDHALKRVADALRLACGDRKTMVARYGGDEFIIVCSGMQDEEVKELCTRAQSILRELNERDEVAYELTISMGFARCTREIQYVPDLIEAADQELYKIKRAREPRR